MPLVRSASFNLLIEIVLRIALMSAFCYMETLPPFKRVIHPADLESLYKYPRVDSYVPGGTLWAIVLSVPCVLSILAWGCCNDCNDAFEILLAWSLALGLNGVLTDGIKLIAGRPRPDFFYRCFPDGVETPKLVCTGDPMVVMDGRKSFPSGHSSLSFCSLGVASVWLCGRLGTTSRRRGSAARVLITLCPLVVAGIVALSRSCDYHHHWEDILVGSLLGFTIAVFCYRQYYNPLSSDLAGVPYIVSNNMAKYGKEISPTKDLKEVESTPLLGKKDDKWI
ncbi:phospholipid phosphatase 5 [Bombyx mandarina]|uniref:Phosphatidic acid phosphatase type 2/haloperoxidase domain-containing protein n=2 Tax=Bombyx TaxID=7090 RepID=A0A8R1WJI3_BOMMO|nr:phospholipid phosphatase 5 isoform X1 [Bombyx mori]XP_028034405.1 phospholipid phosphatase 5 [Bombyx mandarina]